MVDGLWVVLGVPAGLTPAIRPVTIAEHWIFAASKTPQGVILGTTFSGRVGTPEGLLTDPGSGGVLIDNSELHFNVGSPARQKNKWTVDDTS